MAVARYNRTKQVLDRRQTDLTVFLDNVHKPHNVSAIVRSCDAVGVLKLHVVWPDPVIGLRAGTAMGAQHWVDVEVHQQRCAGIRQLQQQGHQVLAAHFSESAVDFRQIDYTRPTAILLGAEKDGVSDEAAALADQHIIIPMLGMVQSLNVSVAAAIVLYEAQRQREEAGMYQQPQLAPEVYDRLLFEWMQPKMAQFCQENQIDYPPLDEEGDLAAPAGWPQSVLDANLGS